MEENNLLPLMEQHVNVQMDTMIKMSLCVVIVILVAKPVMVA